MCCHLNKIYLNKDDRESQLSKHIERCTLNIFSITFHMTCIPIFWHNLCYNVTAKISLYYYYHTNVLIVTYTAVKVQRKPNSFPLQQAARKARITDKCSCSLILCLFFFNENDGNKKALAILIASYLSPYPLFLYV